MDNETNSNITDISTSHPIELNSLNTSTYFMLDTLSSSHVTLDQLKLYTKYPMTYNRILRKLSREAFNSNGQYANVVSYMVTIPTLDFITVCNNSNKSNKKKKASFNQILKKINHKLTTRDILMHCFIDGMYIGILRNTTNKNLDIKPQLGNMVSGKKLEGLALDDNLMIQPLDLDYCKFIGFQNNIQIAAFDMSYFDQFKNGGLTNEIKNYPTEFIKAYLDYKKDGTKQWYKLNPKTTIALKFNANINEPYGRPLGLSALRDIRFAEDYNDSQTSVISELASSIYYMILPEGKETGSCSLNTEQQKNIISAFEAAISSNTSRDGGSKISKISLAPGTKIDRMTKDSSLLKDTLNNENIKKISTSLGFSASALNSSGEGGSSYSTLEININLVMTQIFAILEQIAYEYTRTLNTLIDAKSNEIIDIKYLRTSLITRDKDFSRAKELYTLAGGAITHMIATAGFDVDDYVAIKQMEKDENYAELFEPNSTSFTISKDGKGGAPQIDDPTNSNTIKSKAIGSNNTPKPSTS